MEINNLQMGLATLCAPGLEKSGRGLLGIGDGSVHDFLQKETKVTKAFSSSLSLFPSVEGVSFFVHL
jgi:hypothetical protein